MDKSPPDLVKIAECINEQTGKIVLAINTSSNIDIMNEIEGLQEEINFHKRRNTMRINTSNLCYYHVTFGNNA